MFKNSNNDDETKIADSVALIIKTMGLVVQYDFSCLESHGNYPYIYD